MHLMRAAGCACLVVLAGSVRAEPADEAAWAEAFLHQPRETVAGLTTAVRRELAAYARRQGCPCGCHMDLVTCLVKDKGCPLLKDHARALAKAVLAFQAGRRAPALRTPGGQPVPPLEVIEKANAVSAADARRLAEAGEVFFVDARLPEDFAAGHAPGALNMPVRAFDERLPEFRKRAAAGGTAVCYCPRGCEMSAVLAQKLMALGFTKVRVLEGGWDAWTAAGNPVERSP